jgi:hypothetical protein
MVETFSSTDIKDAKSMVNKWSSENRNCVIVSCELTTLTLSEQYIFIFTVLYETPR